MEESKTPFLKTKEGGLTIAFSVIIAAFFVEVYGLTMDQEFVYIAGFLIILAAIIYSPVDVFIIKKK
ncbi:hypothetical protein [Lacrimispora sp. 38-1]|uniref:hypothetical protein n=1 Tax=Lacrimispora sp. 38-1 TaxID=3125778 RepID=UPI003CE8C8D2